jgi:hypothetical protein
LAATPSPNSFWSGQDSRLSSGMLVLNAVWAPTGKKISRVSNGL